MSPRRIVAATVVSLLVLPARAADAHTDSDVVAVAAGAVATMTLKPTHGCGDSPSIKVSTRAPVAGATGAEVAGWTVVNSADGEDRTIIEWSGGSLDAETTGEFPVEFTVPDAVGTVLTFPFVQDCANGEELAWIDGDPAGEYPAPRLLVLPPGSEAAATVDDVPADVPGREQLVAILDVDGGQAAAPRPTATTSASASDGTPAPTVVDTDDGDGGGSAWPFAVAAVVVLVGGGAVALRRRSAS